MLQAWFDVFLKRHDLPNDYRSVTEQWFVSLAESLHQAYLNQHPLVVGIHGCQGSGKSTLADFLSDYMQHQHGLKVVVLSIDDFYLTRTERSELAQRIHPLLMTRGVPGTHDVELANRVIDGLTTTDDELVFVPRFDKSQDDRVPDAEWDKIQSPVDVVILEGWCLGIPPQSEDELMLPVNAIEALEDDQGIWRHFVNNALAISYRSLFARVHQWVMLQAPSFDCVHRWRLQQEQKLMQRLKDEMPSQVMNEGQLLRFIQHYQRLTEHALRVLPSQMAHVFTLDRNRVIQSVHSSGRVNPAGNG